MEKIIPLFDKCNIKGIKESDYSDFRRVAMLLQDKQHLSEAGLSKIKSIKSNMNLNKVNYYVNCRLADMNLSN